MIRAIIEADGVLDELREVEITGSDLAQVDDSRLETWWGIKCQPMRKLVLDYLVKIKD